MKRQPRGKCYVCSPRPCHHAHRFNKPIGIPWRMPLSDEEAGWVILPGTMRYRSLEELRTEKPYVPTGPFDRTSSAW